MVTGWDFDGTICHAPKGILLKLYRTIERIFPFITLVLPPKIKPTEENIIIITASRNKVGPVAWLKLHKVKYKSITFVDEWANKAYYVKKLCDNYVEIE